METQKIVKTFTELVSIDSPSLGERQLADYLVKRFAKIGIALQEDDAGGRCGSNAGNLYAYVEGALPGEPLLLSSHMDTVAPAFGKKAVVREDGTITSDGTTVLGADDMAGITAILEAITFLKEKRLAHRSFELLFTVGEELYGKGAKEFDYRVVKSRQAYVLDLTGKVGDAAYMAPTIVSFEAKMIGKAAHAGFHPEDGIHAIRAAAWAIMDLEIGRMDEETTANIGRIQGGEGINIVPSECSLQGEIRSLNHEKALSTVEAYRAVFEKAAEKAGAQLVWDTQLHIISYETDKEHPVVKNYFRACEKLGIAPRLVKTFGGSDHNVFAQHGITGIVMANAMNCVHSCEEYTEIEELKRSTQIVTELLTDCGDAVR